MDDLKKAFETFCKSAEEIILRENDLLDKKLAQVVSEKKDASLLHELETKLAVEKKDLEARELVLSADKERNREKTQLLETREKRLEEEKTRLASIMNNI
jgi:hypothetical protein